jgi:4-amino-4-deoxy-L-arabinose transferase-like glycosyltransferase
MSRVLAPGVRVHLSQLTSAAGRWAERRAIAIIVAAALVLRVVAVIFRGPSAMDWDGANFIRTAQNLLAGHGYIGLRGSINVVHAPLYPLLIAALTFVTRNAEESALILAIATGVLFPVVIYVLAKRVFDEKTGIIAAIIVAFHPIMIGLSLQLLADQLAFVLEFAGLAVFFRWLERKRASDLVITGGLIGLAYLARPEAIIDIAIACAALIALGWRDWRRTAGSLLWLCVPFALLMAPYVAFLTNATGHFLWEGKSPVNYAIGVRIAGGMNYIDAADGLGPGGTEAGAELGEGYFVTSRNEPRPSIADRVRFAVRVAPSHIVEIARTLLSFHYGTPLALILAVIGVVSGLRGARAVACAILLASAVGKFVALLSVAHFWERYAAPFAPYMSVFIAAGIVVCASALVRRRTALGRPALRTAAYGLALVALLGAYAATLRDIRSQNEDSRPLAAAGRWIAANDPSARTIMAVTPLVAYYAGDVWNALPAATSANAATYVRKKAPDLVVLEPRDADRTYLAQWRQSGIPGGAQLIYQSPGDPANAIQVYRLSSKPA